MKSRIKLWSPVTIVLVLLFGRSLFCQTEFWEETAQPSTNQIQALAVNPDNILFVGTSGSGILRSTTNGDTWTAINQGLVHSNIFRIAINSSGDIFIGTDEAKIYRSTNNGDSWTEVYSDPVRPFGVVALAINGKGNIFADAGGIVHSPDNGESWATTDNDHLAGYVWEFAFNDSDYVFAAVDRPGWLDDGVYRSKDDGENWIRINDGLPEGPALDLALNKEGSIFVGLAGISSQGQNTDVLYHSRDNGDSWSKVDFPWQSAIGDILINSDDNIFIAVSNHGVYRSENNGQSWSEVNNGLPDSQISVQVFTINNLGVVFAGTWTGRVFRSQVSTTTVEGSGNAIPKRIELAQNYPNPFNPGTTIRFRLAQTGHVTLTVFNIQG
ncbi:MAG: WD40/YVTN/BNR-like repeat-containing protein [bacterium]